MTIDLITLVDDLDRLSDDELRVRYADILTVVRELQKLEVHPGWKFLVQLLEANAANLQRETEGSTFDGMGAAFQDQFKKGMVKGLKRADPLLNESILYYERFRDLLGSALEKEQSNGSSTAERTFDDFRDAANRGDPDLSGSNAGTLCP